MVFYVVFEKMSSSSPMLLIQTAVLGMFFKTGVLKKFSISTGKHPRWSLFLIMFHD